MSFTPDDMGEPWPPPGHPLHSTIPASTTIVSVTDDTPSPPRPNREARRECKRSGHLWKTDGAGTEFCGRCWEPKPS